VCPGPPWNVPHEQARRGVALDDGSETAHGSKGSATLAV
jgi:hypothetical protein